MGIKNLVLGLVLVLVCCDVYAQYGRMSNYELRSILEDEERVEDFHRAYEILISRYMRSDIDSMLFFAESFLEFAKGQEDLELLISAYYNLGRHYAVKGVHDEAIVNLMEAYNLKSSSNNSSRMGQIIGMIGYVYFYDEQYEAATDFYEEALTYFEKANARQPKAIATSTLGSIYFQTKEYGKAKQKFKEALKIKEGLKDTLLMSTDIINLAMVYQKEEKLDSALVYALQSREFDKKMNNLMGLTETLRHLSSINLELGNHSKAEEYALESYEIAKEVGSLILIRDGYNLLYTVFKEAGKSELALENHEHFKIYSDSITNMDTREELVEAQARYDTQKKEQEILLLEAENREARLKMILSIVIGSVLLIGISISYRQSSKRKEKDREQEIQSIQKELESYGMLINAKDEFLNSVIERLTKVSKVLINIESKKELNSLVSSLRHTTKITGEEEHLLNRIDQVNSGFFRKLDQKGNSLTKGDKRLASLVQMELSNKEIGNIIGINTRSVVQARYRLKKKLELQTEDDLVSYLKELA
ncbi:MAG: hypothetical protein ED557_07555 [Balneola sp.]|nr:MAG: hypothetical protein ED557_07555 [Balneola sp.]